MQIGSNCSNCEECISHYSGGCLAGHGDDDFEQITEKSAKLILTRLVKVLLKCYVIIPNKEHQGFINYLSSKEYHESKIRKLCAKFPNILEEVFK